MLALLIRTSKNISYQFYWTASVNNSCSQQQAWLLNQWNWVNGMSEATTKLVIFLSIYLSWNVLAFHSCIVSFHWHSCRERTKHKLFKIKARLNRRHGQHVQGTWVENKFHLRAIREKKKGEITEILYFQLLADDQLEPGVICNRHLHAIEG